MFSANQLAQEETVKVYFKTFLFEKCGKLESNALSTIYYTLHYLLLSLPVFTGSCCLCVLRDGALLLYKASC